MSELAKYKISNIQLVTSSLVLVSFENYNYPFKAGQHVTVSTVGNYESREYSIYSSQTDKQLTILIKIVEDGHFTPKLLSIQKGDEMVISKPHGAFSFQTGILGKHWFIATGTGFAPMNSMTKSNEIESYQVVHGIRWQEEALSTLTIDESNLELCISRERDKSEFRHVNEYIKQQTFSEDDAFYLCGNGSMVYDCKNILRDMGISPNAIYTEVYF